MSKNIICIGECMLEVQFTDLASKSLTSTDLVNIDLSNTDLVEKYLADNGLAFGGDVYNTAFAIQQCSINRNKVNFLSAVGDDEFSQQMIACWQQQDIDAEYVSILTGKHAGLYVVKTDDAGERSFTYWRNESAAREFFQSTQFPTLLDTIAAPRCLYFSGISLAIMSEVNRERLLHYAKQWAESGCVIAFDSNYRPQLWSSIDEARHWVDAAWEVTTIGLPTLDDDQQLFGIESAAQSIEKLCGLGVALGAVKLGKAGCIAFDGDNATGLKIPAPKIDTAKVIDTTGAGDAFNGAFIAIYLEHGNCELATKAGVNRAAETVQHLGAIPRST